MFAYMHHNSSHVGCYILLYSGTKSVEEKHRHISILTAIELCLNFWLILSGSVACLVATAFFFYRETFVPR